MRNHWPIGKYLTVLSRFYQQSMARGLEHLGLGLGQFQFMIVICRNPGIVQDKLAEQLGINKSSVARAVAQLEEKGFVTRAVHSADKRAYQLHPTAKGEALLPEIFRCSQESVDEMTLGFTPEEEEILLVLLERVYQNLGGEPNNIVPGELEMGKGEQTNEG